MNIANSRYHKVRKIEKSEQNKVGKNEKIGIIRLETIKLEAFEYIDKNGEVKKDTETELKHYKDMLLILKKERVQLKKDIRDFEEFEEDTTELKEQLRIKEKEITDIENIINDLEG